MSVPNLLGTFLITDLADFGGGVWFHNSPRLHFRWLRSTALGALKLNFLVARDLTSAVVVVLVVLDVEIMTGTVAVGRAECPPMCHIRNDLAGTVEPVKHGSS